VARDVHYGKTSPFFRMRFKICLNENLDGLFASMNFDAHRRVPKINFVSAAILPSNNRVRHFCATPIRHLNAAKSWPSRHLNAARRHWTSRWPPGCRFRRPNSRAATADAHELVLDLFGWLGELLGLRVDAGHDHRVEGAP
jgi:hypothetical protein